MYTFENRGTYLFVEVTDPVNIKELVSAIQGMADYCQHENLNKILIDARPVHERLSVLDRYTVGVNIAKVIGSKTALALVAREELINHVTENAAVNRYGKLKVFSDMDKAMAWLELGE